VLLRWREPASFVTREDAASHINTVKSCKGERFYIFGIEFRVTCVSCYLDVSSNSCFHFLLFQEGKEKPQQQQIEERIVTELGAKSSAAVVSSLGVLAPRSCASPCAYKDRIVPRHWAIDQFHFVPGFLEGVTNEPLDFLQVHLFLCAWRLDALLVFLVDVGLRGYLRRHDAE
jgi:hypothetical protein